MRALRPVAWLLFALGAQAQNGLLRPEFTVYQVTGRRLWPGTMSSIHGKNLGPRESCVRNAGVFRPEGPNSPEELATVERQLPTELCLVQVLIDEEPVPLIYVSAGQINFVVPGSRSFGDKVMVRVVHAGASSVPVSLQCGPDRMSLYQEQVTYTGMPVWVRLYNVAEEKRPVQLQWGISIWPPSICSHIEVKYNDSLLPALQIKSPVHRIVSSGNPCSGSSAPDRQSLAGRIPLHLRYRFDRPGTYFVRYVPAPEFGMRPTTAETEWTPIEVKAGTAEQRRKWLLSQAAPPPSDRESLLYDFLPSIFGYGDSAALNMALGYLYHADARVVASTATYLRDYYAAPELIAALRRIVQRKGPNRTVDQLLRDIGAKPL